VNNTTGAVEATAVIVGLLREVHRHASQGDRPRTGFLILGAGTRITIPPDLSAESIPIGASVLVTVTRSERGEWIARRIEHEPRRNGRGR
jgi:hypothetical protein